MPLRHRPLVWLALAVALVLVAGLSWRCSRKEAVPGKAALALRNLAGSSWRISLAEIGGNSAPVLHRVAPRAEVQVTVAPGTYLVAQTLLDIHGQTLDHRTLRWVAEEGVRYDWPLVSLQTTLEDPP